MIIARVIIIIYMGNIKLCLETVYVGNDSIYATADYHQQYFF